MMRTAYTLGRYFLNPYRKRINQEYRCLPELQAHIQILHSIFCLECVAQHPVCFAIQYLFQRHEPFFKLRVCHLMCACVVITLYP
jgi:hypothetical protein